MSGVGLDGTNLDLKLAVIKVVTQPFGRLAAMNILLTNSSVTIDGQPLPARLDATAMLLLAGPGVSSRDIPMHPSGIRKANVSASGIVWYVDYPEDRISHFHLAVSPSDTPEHPATPFLGAIHLNGVLLNTKTSEASFVRHGQGMPFHGHIHSWSYETAMHSISFLFKRQRNRLGRRAGTHKLAFIGISFRDKNK
jgi:hypothetical protein